VIPAPRAAQERAGRWAVAFVLTAVGGATCHPVGAGLAVVVMVVMVTMAGYLVKFTRYA